MNKQNPTLPANSANLAQQAVVHGSSRSAGGQSIAVTRDSEHNLPGQGTLPTRASRNVQIDCVDVIKQRSTSEGFSRQAANFIAAARMSTFKSYNNKVNRFAHWCEGKGIDTFQSTIQQIADFLCELFFSGLAPVTIAGYKSALASVIPCLANRDSPEVAQLNVMVKGMSNLRPRQPVVIPAWRLSLVLNVLAKHPFEPLCSASLKHLTLKAVFLLAASSARRRSEIHALSAERDRFIVSGEGLHLLPRAEFMSKNQSLRYPGKPIIIPKQTRFDRDASVWCPVRALTKYKKRTDSLRLNDRHLWICHKKPYGAASMDSISRWVVECIHEIVTGHQVQCARAHDVRGIAASTALYNGVPLDDVMAVAQWHCESSFTDYYMRDVSDSANLLALAVLKRIVIRPHCSSPFFGICKKELRSRHGRARGCQPDCVTDGRTSEWLEAPRLKSKYHEGEKNTGFYVLYGNMKQGQTSSKELIDFLRESCTVEENYSKLLTKLAKTAMNSNHVGTFAPFWTILKVLAEKLSTLHMQLVHSWADLIKDVNRYNEEQHRKHKSMKDAESNTMESVQSIQQTTTSLRKAREIYHTRCLEVERLKRDNASQKDIEKSEVKCKKANEEYRKLVDNYANIRNEFEEKMTESCKHFQELEEKHIHQMKDFIDTYNKSWENQHALLGQVHRECKQNCDQLSVATLMQAFITAKTTGTSKPALGNWKAWPGPIEFEEPDLSSLPPARSMSPVSLENADSLSDVKKQESNGSPSPVMSDQPGPLSRSVKLRVSRTWFLKSKNKRKEKSKKKKKDERDTESMGTTDSQESQNSPVVDADGYIIRTDNPHENNGDKNSWYTSSESDSDNDEPQKIRVEIKPLSPSGTQSTARLEDIRASVEALRLSPTATKRRSQTPVERMKRSHSVSDTLDSTKPGDNLLSLDLFATASSASTPTGGNYSNHFSLPSPMSPNIDISINSSAATTPANNSSVNELFISEVNDTSPALPNKLRQTSMSHISTTSISNFPAPPLRLPSRSKNMLPHSTARPTGRMSPASFMSRSESTSSDTFHTTPSIGSSRGPSPLTLGMSDVVPLAVAFTETVNAWFRGTDATRCMSRIHGGIMMSFPAGVIKVFTDNPCPPMLSFRLKNTARIEQVLVNKQLVIEDNVENVADSLSYSFDMAALTDHLRHQGEQSKSASYFNIDILKYQVKSDTGVEAMPLPLVCYWKCDAHHTDFRLDYKYNSSAMSTEATIKNVTMAVTMDGDVTNMQSLPSGTWSGENKRAMWKLDDISNVSEAGSQGSIRAKFNVNNGPSALSGTAVQFTCEGSTLSGVEFELLGSGYRLSLIKKRFASGKYLVEPDSDTKYV